MKVNNTYQSLKRNQSLEQLVSGHSFLGRLHDKELYLSMVDNQAAEVYIKDEGGITIHVGNVSTESNGQLCLSLFQEWVVNEMVYVQ